MATKRITELKPTTTDSVAYEWQRRYEQHMKEIEKRLWAPVIDIDNIFQKLKTSQEMKLVKVVSKQEEQYIYANDARQHRCFFYDHAADCTGVALLTAKQTTECFVRWSNGNQSSVYPNFDTLVKELTIQNRYHRITVHQIES